MISSANYIGSKDLGDMKELFQILKSETGMSFDTNYAIEQKDSSRHKSSVTNFFRKKIAALIAENNLIINLDEINLRVAPLNKSGKLKENIGYSRIHLNSIVASSWNDLEELNSFKRIISRTHLILAYSKFNQEHFDKNENSHDLVTLNNVIVWKPTKKDLRLIGEDYDKIRRILIDGVVQKEKIGTKSIMNVDNLPKESDTEYIHIRPKARNKDDIDEGYHNAFGKRLTKRAFYLNKPIINKILDDDGQSNF
jgi:hypothetical protein